jgi:hypothetical protein
MQAPLMLTNCSITFQNIRVENATKYGLVIQQDYLNGGPTGNHTSSLISSHFNCGLMHKPPRLTQTQQENRLTVLRSLTS